MRWKAVGIAQLAWFIVAATVAYAIRPGIVPWWEALHRGMMVALLAFPAELANGWLVAARRRWMLRAGFLALACFAAPLVASLHPLHTVPKRTPAAFGFAFEDVRFVTEDGVHLGGWLVPAECARGNVIFCHGHGRNRGHVAGWLPTLRQLGLNVLAFDFRGHGESEGHISTFGQCEVTDLLAAEQLLRQRFPGKPLLLAGVSLGAAVSLQALGQLPNLRGVWSEGSFARFSDVAANKFRFVPLPLRRALMQLYYGLGWLDCGFRATEVNPIDCLRAGTVPIFFCHGCKDELVPLAQGQSLFDTYPGPKDNWWVEGATHYNVRQKNREEYLRKLRNFMERCLQPAPQGMAG